MRRILVLLAIVATASACDESLLNPGDDMDFETCETAEAIRGQIESHLGSSLTEYELLLLDNAALLSDLRQGQAVMLPGVDEEGELVTLDLPSFEEAVLSPDLTEFTLKLGNEESRTVPAEDTDIYRLDCQQGSGQCGMISFLDASGQQLEVAIASNEHGFTLIESASSLLTNLEGGVATAEPGCHVVYNSDFHGGFNFAEYPLQGAAFQPAGEVTPAFSAEPLASSHRFEATIPIVLDSDHEFYSINSANVWRRQSAIIGFTNLFYGLIEPLSSNNFQLLFEVESQETWMPDFGPTSTDRDVLLDEINDPAYFMLNHPDNNEVSYFFVGYDMDGGIAGKAGGVCNLPGYDVTFGSSEDHQNNHAWGQQVQDEDAGFAFATLFGRIVVAAHEIGHMIGGIHGDGAAESDGVCAGGALDSMCGTSLMTGGSGGAPDFREPFFTDTNDENFITCVGDAL